MRDLRDPRLLGEALRNELAAARGRIGKQVPDLERREKTKSLVCFVADKYLHLYPVPDFDDSSDGPMCGLPADADKHRSLRGQEREP